MRAGLEADSSNSGPVPCRLYLRVYGPDDKLALVQGPEMVLEPGARRQFAWRMPDTGCQPIATIGVELSAAYRADGSVYLDYLTWDGAPDVVLTRPAAGGTMWRRAWVDGVVQYEARWPEPYRLVQNHGTGLLIQGTRAWTDYRASADLTAHLAAAAGLGARVQGMRRYYALLLCDDGMARLIKALDGDTVLAQAAFPWTVERTYVLSLQVVGIRIQAWIDDRLLFDVQDTDRPFSGGGVALICREGCVSSAAVTVHPSH